MSRPRPSRLVALLVLAGCGRSPSGDAAATRDAATTARSADPGCPKDLLGAVGKPCAAEGTTCKQGNEADPRRLLMCSGGTWRELNVPPMH